MKMNGKKFHELESHDKDNDGNDEGERKRDKPNMASWNIHVFDILSMSAYVLTN